MSGQPISQLNEGIAAFKSELTADTMAAKRVEVGIVNFGPVRVASDFQTADAFVPPSLAAGGDTPLGSAVEHGVDLLRPRTANSPPTRPRPYPPPVLSP